MGTFSAGIDRLKADVGIGKLEGTVEVDQHYALYQHEMMNLEHPRGGGPHYLSGPLLTHYIAYLQILAEAVLAGSLHAAMILIVEDLSAQLDPAAPIDEDPNPIRLRRSGQPSVTDNGSQVYHRPPIDPREPYIVSRRIPGGPRKKK